VDIADKELKAAIKAVKSAGAILKENFGKKHRVIRKSIREMVSEIDMRSQEAILEILEKEFPAYGIMTEEKSFIELGRDKNWIIDPIDGTHNYIAGLPFSGVSIALTEGNNFHLGVIYFPMEGELYIGIKDNGAYCNGNLIAVSKNPDISKAIINYDNRFYSDEKAFDYYKILTQKAFTTRIFGTATKDICLIASGRIDGRIWLDARICDIAAGIVILTEAGGRITDINGNSCVLDSKQVIASNGRVHNELLNIFKEG